MKGGLSGIASKDETRDRWTLTAHLLAAVSRNFQKMCGLKITKPRRKNMARLPTEQDRANVNQLVRTMTK